MDCSPPGSSVHGISKTRILEWVAISFSRGSSQPRAQTRVSHIGRWILYHLSHQWSPPRGFRLCQLNGFPFHKYLLRGTNSNLILSLSALSHQPQAQIQRHINFMGLRVCHSLTWSHRDHTWGPQITHQKLPTAVCAVWITAVLQASVSSTIHLLDGVLIQLPWTFPHICDSTMSLCIKISTFTKSRSCFWNDLLLPHALICLKQS